MTSKNEAQAEYNSWLETYKPSEFVEYSHEAYEKLLAEVDPHLVWTNHGTCETEKYSNGILEFSEHSCCYTNFGWYIAEVPWEGDEDTFISVSTEWAGPCPVCNEDGEDNYIQEACPECDGEGYTQVYFD